MNSRITKLALPAMLLLLLPFLLPAGLPPRDDPRDPGPDGSRRATPGEPHDALPDDGQGVLQTPFENEVHFRSLRQLTFGGENAEAYFSFDERSLIFQSTRDSFRCDQEYVMDVASGDTRLVSGGKGRTTCGYFLPGDSTILYATTQFASADCPPSPDRSQGYVWAVYRDYDIVLGDMKGGVLRS